jgi:hypothetical protein
MLIKYLHRVLTAQNPKAYKTQVKFWLSLSLSFVAIYAILGLREAFSSEYVVQDDARQHIFWMLRFLDPKLFPNDLIADYFQSVAPAGYSSFYGLMAFLGVNPLILSKLLPIVLGMLTTGYCFGISLQILPIPATGFMATLMLNQHLWMKDDLVSATPRAFAYPLMLAFLYYLLRASLFPCLLTIALLGLFYPQCVFICVGVLVLRLWDLRSGNFGFSREKSHYLFCAAGVGIAFLVMLPYALKSSEFGPVITVTQAKQLPEFLPKGRSAFFHETLKEYFLFGVRSGMFPRSLFTPVTLCAALVLPLLLRFHAKFPLLKQVTGNVIVLAQMFLASVGMFLIAHWFLFKLHLPSRYTGVSFRIIVALLAAIALTAILDTIFQACEQPAKAHPQARQFLALASTAVISIALVCYPSFVNKFPVTKYKQGKEPALYEFFQSQPKDILIASLEDEANNLPTFSRRSVLVGSEYAIPYHVGYYRQLSQRIHDLIRAQYSPNLADVRIFIHKYGVDFWLLERKALTPKNLAQNRWLNQYQPTTTQALANLQQGKTPAILSAMERCAVFETPRLVLLQADCILNSANLGRVRDKRQYGTINQPEIR